MAVVERAIEAHQNAIEDKREKLQSARQQAQPNADLRASAPVLGYGLGVLLLRAPAECVRSTPGRDLPTLEAENKELRERLAKVDAEMAEIKYAVALRSTHSRPHAERRFLRSKNSRASWRSRVASLFCTISY